MESEESSRPSIEFPLGLALLLVLLFFMSVFFTCCVHWDKLRSLLKPSRGEEDNSHVQEDIEHLPYKSSPLHQESKQNQVQNTVPVLMPGDQVPKFIAMACPCQPSIMEEKITVKMEKPPTFPVPLHL
ncbi:uncharacterized protein At5g65660 [Jatropha curcas]|uniref:uncharacterized protein At5g65660 n=1 Tax=Jatropha curcas TaxID=180498 RepID=UPI0005FB971D|nr:uncharacterized protein At5g65660 [Jatropha curcas]